MFIVVDSDFHQIFIMFIMKTVLLISVLCVTLSVSAAAVVPVGEILTKERADDSAVPVEGVVSEERADVSVPAVEVAEETKLAASDDTADVEPVVLLKNNTARNANSKCPQDWHEYKNKCYLLVKLVYSWTNAEFLCQNMGASLASAHNLQEDHYLKQMAWKAGFLSAWIGGHRFQGYWRWDDGTPFDYNNWYAHNGNGYDCIYLNSQDIRGWTSERCNLGHPFICSFNATC
ncbi:Type-2 ice-structuring protein [Larimichthys crocea]|uniref:Uncharacterized protein n=1 Tax=Larimichthys crocea TaxID=215358 RepID=A0ACD3R3P3_LARCR|nr:Type-2 ice-structuring protein [Larimichthys crocea]